MLYKYELTAVITLSKRIAQHIREETSKPGITSEEYIIEFITQKLDPRNRAIEYIGIAKELLEHAKEELKRGNIRQAAEKIRGITALVVKAYAYWREGKRLASHYELWKYKDKIVDKLGEWVRDTMNAG